MSAKGNGKIYSALLLLTDGHAKEIVMRTPNNDGRRALFSLRFDAHKQTDGQVIALQNEVNTMKCQGTKNPAAFLDRLQRKCRELDSLYRLQETPSSFTR